MTQLCGHLLTLLGSECHHKIILLQTKSDLSYNMFVKIILHQYILQIQGRKNNLNDKNNMSPL